MEEYYEYAMRFELIYEELRSSCDIERAVDEVCELRPYFDNRMKQTLLEIGLFHIDYFDAKQFSFSFEELKEVGLVAKNGSFLLEGGYIIPIRDIEGYLIALVGWFPGRPTKTKYITATGKYFSKRLSLFNIDNAVKLGNFEFVFVVEGIFDCLAMRSIGLPCVSIQGSEMSDEKRLILKSFKKIIAIPDNDTIGRQEMINWNIQGNCTFVELSGSINISDKIQIIKDCDDLIKYFEGVYEIMMEFVKSKSKIEKLAI